VCLIHQVQCSFKLVDIFRPDGESMIIVTAVYTKKKEMQRIIVHGFKPKTKRLQGKKFNSFGDTNLNIGKIKCLNFDYSRTLGDAHETCRNSTSPG
jgi:hypothetical protein